jgi:hypothetical protein
MQWFLRNFILRVLSEVLWLKKGSYGKLFVKYINFRNTDVSELCTAYIIMAMNRCDDGGSKHLRNIGKFVPDYTAQHPRGRLYSVLFRFFSCEWVCER